MSQGEDDPSKEERSSFFFMELIHRFTSYCLRHGLFRSGDKILMGISGGCDSMALLDLFARIRESEGLFLAAAHLHHGLRGESADLDVEFVRRHCRDMDIPLFTERADVRGFASDQGRSIEEAGRILRYRFFRRLRESGGFDRTALGHHADDHAETVILRLIRGAGLRGARGILPVNGPLIRPLLSVSKSEIQAYAVFRQLEYRTDPTNRDREYLRNRIRLDFLDPLRSDFGEGVIRNIGRFGEVAAEALEFIDHEAEKAFTTAVRDGAGGEILLDIFPFLSYFKAVKKAVLSRIFSRLSKEGDFLHSGDYHRILSLSETGKNGCILRLPAGIQVTRTEAHLVFYRESSVEPEEVGIPAGSWVRVNDDFMIRAAIQGGPAPSFEPRCLHPMVEYLDRETVQFPLTVRFFRKGDRFIPLGMRNPKKLKRFFIDEKIPRHRRGSIPLLSDAAGPIWIVGHRISERVRITDRTKTLLKVEAVPINEPQPNTDES
jgi:tRNA(Ile)-lysidine synthase